MPLKLVQRGGGILRNLPLNGSFARPIRVISSQHNVRRIAFVARRTQSAAVLPRSSSIIANLVRSYATTGESTGKTKTTNTKSTTKTAGKKPAKKAAKKPAKKTEGAKRGRGKGPKTEKQKEREKIRQRAQYLRELKETALVAPKALPSSAWVIAVTKKTAEVPKDLQPRGEVFKRATQLAQEISAEERQRYVDQANANKAANQAAYEAWVQSHTPHQIYEANKARRQLSRIKGGKKVTLIKDDRLVKRPTSAWIYYFMEKRDSNAVTVAEESKAVASEWRSLSDLQKAKYYDMSQKDLLRYEREHLEIYGVAAPKIKAKKSEA
ncbi:HMG-box domain-containing protein [Aspergillus stella-maris]|uniref:HMG-box domain-containing protein n=1 Tax=Aspergillus stella-maris TaxID=1810926 RepID=UPI003CCCAC75